MSVTFRRNQFMKKLPPELFKRYLENPLSMDLEVRKYCGLREDRYYTVSIWPEEVASMVKENNKVREVKTKKISKSDQ